MSEPLLTSAQVADLLGFSPATVVDWAEQGTLPAFKIGGRLRYRESEVLKWVEDKRLRGPGARGEVSPTPSAVPAQGVVFQLSPTPLGGEEHAS